MVVRWSHGCRNYGVRARRSDAEMELGVLGNFFPGCISFCGLANGQVQLRSYYGIFLTVDIDDFRLNPEK